MRGRARPHQGRRGAQIKEELRRRIDRRRATQPIEMPNAGSIFRNPPGDYAARLIEAAGCKGLRHGGAQVSEKHANFIVNAGRRHRVRTSSRSSTKCGKKFSKRTRSLSSSNSICYEILFAAVK